VNCQTVPRIMICMTGQMSIIVTIVSDHAPGHPSGSRRPRGRLVNHTHLGECGQSLSLALPAQSLGAMTLSA
jgi:hypothetical protein